MPSADVLGALPSIERTRELMRSLAVLDAILLREWADRIYSFDAAWSPGEQMGSMRDGMGNDWFCWFGPPGAAIVGFDHESPMSPWAQPEVGLWPGLTDGLPAAFEQPVLREPAFTIDDSTFLLWREPGDAAWRCGPLQPPPADPDADGAAWMLELVLADDPRVYARFALEDYEMTLSPDAVEAVWRSQPLTDDIVRGLNPDVALADVADDVGETGYPLDP